MIYKDNERVKITGTDMYKELCAAFPEIEKKQPVTLELIESLKTSVETSDGQPIKVWPERVVTYQFDAMEGADKVVWRLQEKAPEKNKVTGDYSFAKFSRALTTTNNPTKVFVTDPSGRNNLEELFLLWHFYPQIINGKAGNGVKGAYRFVNAEKDAQEVLTQELMYANTIVALNAADINVLVSLFETIYETQAPSGVVKNTLVSQFSNRIKSDKALLKRVSDFFAGVTGGVSQDVVNLVKAAIDKGVLVTGEDGSGVFLQTANKREEVIAEKTTDDVEAIAEFVSKNNSLKGTLKRVTK